MKKQGRRTKQASNRLRSVACCICQFQSHSHRTHPPTPHTQVPHHGQCVYWRPGRHNRPLPVLCQPHLCRGKHQALLLVLVLVLVPAAAEWSPARSRQGQGQAHARSHVDGSGRHQHDHSTRPYQEQGSGVCGHRFPERLPCLQVRTPSPQPFPMSPFPSPYHGYLPLAHL